MAVITQTEFNEECFGAVRDAMEYEEKLSLQGDMEEYRKLAGKLIRNDYEPTEDDLHFVLDAIRVSMCGLFLQSQVKPELKADAIENALNLAVLESQVCERLRTL